MRGTWSKAALITVVAVLGSVGCGGPMEEEGTFEELDEVAQEETGDVSALDGDYPTCKNVTASPSLLWPPNHTFHLIELSGAKCVTIKSVTQDEPVDDGGDGNFAPDAKLVDGKLYLRAERSGQGDGRVYCIKFTAKDKYGKPCKGTVEVGVPHDQGQGSEPINSGCEYNSFDYY
jgi:chitinase